MNKQEIEKAINGFELLKPILQAQVLKINYEGLGVEDAKELGLIVRLPCKIGATIYDVYEFIENRCSPEILEYKAKTIEIGEDKHGIYFDIDSTIFRPDDFGKTVFLTQTEAETKILEVSNG